MTKPSFLLKTQLNSKLEFNPMSTQTLHLAYSDRMNTDAIVGSGLLKATCVFMKPSQKVDLAKYFRKKCISGVNGSLDL